MTVAATLYSLTFEKAKISIWGKVGLLVGIIAITVINIAQILSWLFISLLYFYISFSISATSPKERRSLMMLREMVNFLLSYPILIKGVVAKYSLRDMTYLPYRLTDIGYVYQPVHHRKPSPQLYLTTLPFVNKCSGTLLFPEHKKAPYQVNLILSKSFIPNRVLSLCEHAHLNFYKKSLPTGFIVGR